MRTNLIQAYLNGSPAAKQYNSDKAAKDFDVHKELNNRTFIKPLPSNGKLVRNNLFDIPAEFFKDVKYDINALRHSVKGEANDHELGRLNDMGMKLGGVAIASYLFTRKSTPLTKVMEFVGLASFFAAMDVWPKLALQLPAYLVHGFNIRQKYEDNYGRKKLLYQDHQFIPWDLYSDEEINKIGNRLKVPKDIPNRREFIQEKMRKIALQNNTMWMLTAGLATPITSALICNALTNPISKYQDGKINQKADNLLLNFNEEIKKVDYSKHQQELENLLSENKGKHITSELFEQIHSKLSEGLDRVVATDMQKDLENLIPTGSGYTINQGAVDNIQNAIKTQLAPLNLADEDLARILPNQDSLNHSFESKNLFRSGVKDFSEYSKEIQNVLNYNISEFIKANPDNPVNRKLLFVAKKLVHSPEFGADSPILKSLKFTPSAVLNEGAIKTIESASKILNQFKAEVGVLDKFAYLKAAQAPETILANSWNNITDDMLKSLNFTPKEIAKARIDREITGPLLREKLEYIVSDDTRYNQFVDNMFNKLSELHEKMASIDVPKDNNTNSYLGKVDTTYDGAAESLRKLGMNSLAQSINGKDGDVRSSAKHIQISFVKDRITGVKSSFYRLLNTVDVYRRIAQLDKNPAGTLHNKMPLQVKEEMLEFVKQMLLDAHTSDYAVKFFALRHPEINPPANASPEELARFYSQVEVQNGKVVNKVLGTHPENQLVELSNDKGFFGNVMRFVYKEPPNPDTVNRGQTSLIWEDFMNYRKELLDILGGDSNFAKPYHLVDGIVNSTSERRFLRLGCAPDEMFYKLCKQKFNSNKWFKMFGGIGAGLLGVTVFSQFFMGKMKVPTANKENK